MGCIIKDVGGFIFVNWILDEGLVFMFGILRLGKIFLLVKLVNFNLVYIVFCVVWLLIY